MESLHRLAPSWTSVEVSLVSGALAEKGRAQASGGQLRSILDVLVALTLENYASVPLRRSRMLARREGWCLGQVTRLHFVPFAWQSNPNWESVRWCLGHIENIEIRRS